MCSTTPDHVPICFGWKMLTLGKGQQSDLSSLHAVVNPMGTTWSRWADPDSKYVQVTHAVEWRQFQVEVEFHGTTIVYKYTKKSQQEVPR